MDGGGVLDTVDDQNSPSGLSRRDAADDGALWYIDYADVTNAVHFLLIKIDRELQQQDTTFENRKIFSCPQCRGEWTLLNVAQNGTLEGFRSDACSGVLEEADNTADDVGAIRSQVNFSLGCLWSSTATSRYR